jgi:flagellar biogenesis protein FliO
MAVDFREHSRQIPLVRWLCSLAGKFIERSQLGEQVLFIEERLSFGPKKQLLVVNCYGRRFLMACSADSVTSLVEVPQKNGVELRGYCQ